MENVNGDDTYSFTLEMLGGDAPTHKESALNLLSNLTSDQQEDMWLMMVEKIMDRHERDLFLTALEKANG